MEEIIVGNIGTVYRGGDEKNAQENYDHYVLQSNSGVGRAGNEPVTWMRNGEIVKEHTPLESVDLIASGYEWTCPKCDKLNHEIEFKYGEKVKCRATWHERNLAVRSKGAIPAPKGCGASFATEMPEHAT
jgi:hypothetical protein